MNIDSLQISKMQFMQANYTVDVCSDDDEDDPGFMAVCKQLNGLMGYGPTPEAAVESFHQTKSDWYDLAVEVKVPIPDPRY